jgi:hypothetical protein
VALTVTATPPVVLNLPGYVEYFTGPEPSISPNPQAFPIRADQFPGSFSVSVVTDNGVNWLSATPSTATAPATITVAGNLANLGPGKI